MGMIFNAHYSGSSGNLYSVIANDKILLIDPGVSTLKINKKVDTTKVYGALISHSHLDHCKGVSDLTKKGKRCFASPQTIKAIGNNLIQPIYANKPFTCGDFQVVPFDVKHDAAGTYGFYVAHGDDRLLYITDTPYIQPKFKDLTIIAIEANYSDDTMAKGLSVDRQIRTINNHMGIEQTIGLLKDNDLSKVREIHLLHLSDENSDAENFKLQVQQATGKAVYVA